MFFLVLLLSIWVFIKTISYGIFELKNNNNKPGGIVVIVIAFISLIVPNLAVVIG